MRRPSESAGEPRRVPDAEQPISRSGEQELASGRTAATGVHLLAWVTLAVAAAVAVVLGLVVLVFVLA